MEALSDIVVSGSLLWAAPVALIAGFLSFFSPCIVPLLPAYLAYSSGVSAELIVQNKAPRSRLVVSSVLFVLGFSAMFTATGAAVGSIGLWGLVYGDWVAIGTGVVLILLGMLVFLDKRLPGLGFGSRIRVPDGGLLFAPLIGAALAITWLPCVGPILGTIYTLAYQSGSATRSVWLLLAYSVGLGLPFIAAAAALTRAMKAAEWMRSHRRVLARLSGTFLVLTGTLFVSGLFPTIVQRVQILALGWGFTGF